MITGGEGNAPINDPGWPKGAAAIFNTQSRIAWWEGPPFGGGQWHSECRGDAKALNDVLASFAKLDQKNKRVIRARRDRPSFWLNPNREPAKRDAARIDWVLMVWQPENWKRLHAMPADLESARFRRCRRRTTAEIDVFAGGNIRWADVTVPKGSKWSTSDWKPTDSQRRMESCSRARSSTWPPIGPLAGKHVHSSSSSHRPKGGYRLYREGQSAADAQGRWVLKKLAGRMVSRRR